MDEDLYVEEDYWDDDYVQSGITINWKTRVIFVPLDVMTIIQTVPHIIRQLDLDYFRLELTRLLSEPDGIISDDTHFHNTEVTLGSETYARVIGILNNYTVTFEDGYYGVNLYGANSNVADKQNLNNVSVRSNNSAGLIISSGGDGGDCDIVAIAHAVWEYNQRTLTSGASSGDVNIVSVNGEAVDSVDDFKADVTELSVDVNVVAVGGITVDSPDDLKADEIDMTETNELIIASKVEIIENIEVTNEAGARILSAMAGGWVKESDGTIIFKFADGTEFARLKQLNKDGSPSPYGNWGLVPSE